MTVVRRFTSLRTRSSVAYLIAFTVLCSSCTTAPRKPARALASLVPIGTSVGTVERLLGTPRDTVLKDGQEIWMYDGVGAERLWLVIRDGKVARIAILGY